MPLLMVVVSPANALVPIVAAASLGFLALLGAIGAKAGGCQYLARDPTRDLLVRIGSRDHRWNRQAVRDDRLSGASSHRGCGVMIRTC
jgi:hypothetical protein